MTKTKLISFVFIITLLVAMQPLILTPMLFNHKSSLPFSEVAVEKKNTSNVKVMDSTSPDAILSNVTIDDTVYITETSKAVMDNVTIYKVIAAKEGKVNITNAKINYLTISDMAEIYLENVTIISMSVDELAQVTLINCTITDNIDISSAGMITIKDSTISELADSNLGPVVVSNTNLSTYSAVLSVDEAPRNTKIAYSNISWVTFSLPDVEYFKMPSITLAHVDIGSFQVSIGYIGPGVLQGNSVETGEMSYFMSLDDYSKNSIDNLQITAFVFIGDWTIKNLTIPSSLNEIYFINGTIRIHDMNLTSMWLYDYNAKVIFKDTTATFHTLYTSSYLEVTNSTIHGEIYAYDGRTNIENSNVTTFRVNGQANVSISNSYLDLIFHSTDDYGRLNMFNVTVDTLIINDDTVNLDTVNVLSELGFYDHVYISNITNVNTTTLSVYADIFRPANISHGVLQLSPGDTFSSVVPPNVSYTTLYIDRISIHGTTLRILDTILQMAVYSYSGTLIINGSEVYGRMYLSTSTVTITNSKIESTSLYYFYAYKSTLFLENTTVKYLYSYLGEDYLKNLRMQVCGFLRHC